MKTKEFYKRLKIDLIDNSHPEHKYIIKDIQITSLEQVLGIFRSVMIRNSAQIDESIQMRKELKALCSVLDISEKDLT